MPGMLKGESPKGDVLWPWRWVARSHVAREKLNGGYWRGNITELHWSDSSCRPLRTAWLWLVGWPCTADHPSWPAVIFSTSSTTGHLTDEDESTRPTSDVLVLWRVGYRLQLVLGRPTREVVYFTAQLFATHILISHSAEQRPVISSLYQ